MADTPPWPTRSLATPVAGSLDGSGANHAQKEVIPSRGYLDWSREQQLELTVWHDGNSAETSHTVQVRCADSMARMSRLGHTG